MRLLSNCSSCLKTVGALFLVAAIVFHVAICVGDETESDVRDADASAEYGQPAAKKLDPRAMEVQFTDNSVLMLLLADEKLEIATPYGKLAVPTDEIMQIRFAQRLPSDVREKVDQAIADLAKPQESVARAAAAVLLGLKQNSYLAVIKATKSSDFLLAARAIAVRDELREELGDAVLTLRDSDLIETANARIVGRITVQAITVKTQQFGELAMRVSDVRNLRSQTLIERTPKKEPIEVLPNPGNLQAYAGSFGKTFHFRVTGGSGPLYGTDVYTTDSTLAAAAVHTGVLAVGETGVVAVKIVPSPASFVSSARNGITSSSWGQYTSAYQVIKNRKKKRVADQPKPLVAPPKIEAIRIFDEG